MRGHELTQVLLTLGVAFVINDMVLVIWGGDTFTVPVPEALRGTAQLFGVYYPKYRLFVLATGCVVFAALWLLLQRTRIGALIRAGVDDAEMVEASGINIRRVFLMTFLLGSALAGLGAFSEGLSSRSIRPPMRRSSCSALPWSSLAAVAAWSALP